MVLIVQREDWPRNGKLIFIVQQRHGSFTGERASEGDDEG